MKVLKVTGPNKIDFFEEKIPEVGPYDVLTKVKYCGVCGTDAAILSGDTSLVRDGLVQYPVRIGHEWSGIVEKVGSNVTEFKNGDRVTGDTVVTCGICKGCLSGSYYNCENLRSVGTVNAWDGGFAEYTLFPQRHIYKIPDSVPLDEAALAEPAAISMAGVYCGGLKPGQTVLVIGTGAIGLYAAAIASIAGASKVFLSGRNDMKLAVGKKLGADFTVNIRVESLKEVLMKHTEGKGVDLVIEASGSITAFKESIDVVKTGGTISLLGFFEKKADGIDLDSILFKNIKIIGITAPNTLIPTLALMASRKVDFSLPVTQRYSFDNAIEAVKAVRENNQNRIKILVEF